MRNAMDAQEVAVGWWPGDARYGKAAFYAYAHPAPDGLRRRRRSRRRRRAGTPRSASTSSTGTTSCAAADPHALALEFARSAFRHACRVCGWDDGLAASADGDPPPVS